VLVHDVSGASQTQIAIASGKTNPKINAIMQGTQKVQYLELFECFADALEMPGHARTLLGLAPQATPDMPGPARPTRPTSSGPASHAVHVRAEADTVAAAAAEASADRIRLAAECDPDSLEWLQAESLEITRRQALHPTRFRAVAARPATGLGLSEARPARMRCTRSVAFAPSRSTAYQMAQIPGGRPAAPSGPCPDRLRIVR
jgi:hypothetical protein